MRLPTADRLGSQAGRRGWRPQGGSQDPPRPAPAPRTRAHTRIPHAASTLCTPHWHPRPTHAHALALADSQACGFQGDDRFLRLRRRPSGARSGRARPPGRRPSACPQSGPPFPADTASPPRYSGGSCELGQVWAVWPLVVLWGMATRAGRCDVTTGQIVRRETWPTPLQMRLTSQRGT